MGTAGSSGSLDEPTGSRPSAHGSRESEPTHRGDGMPEPGLGAAGLAETGLEALVVDDDHDAGRAPWHSGGSSVSRECWAVRIRASHKRAPWSRGASGHLVLVTVAAQPPRPPSRPQPRVTRGSPSRRWSRKARSAVTRPRKPRQELARHRAGWEARVTWSRDGCCATSSTTESPAAPGHPRVALPTVVEEGAQRLSRDHASRGRNWHGIGRVGSLESLGLVTVAAQPPRPPSRPQPRGVTRGSPSRRWSRKARSACHETTQAAAGTATRHRAGWEPRVTWSRDGCCATSSTTESPAAPGHPRVALPTVVEEGAQRLSRDHASRGRNWHGIGRVGRLTSLGLVTVAAQPPRPPRRAGHRGRATNLPACA